MMIMNGTWGTLQLPKKAGWASFPRSEETCKDKKDTVIGKEMKEQYIIRMQDMLLFLFFLLVVHLIIALSIPIFYNNMFYLFCTSLSSNIEIRIKDLRLVLLLSIISGGLAHHLPFPISRRHMRDISPNNISTRIFF